MATPQFVRDAAREAETTLNAISAGQPPADQPPAEAVDDGSGTPPRVADNQFGVGQSVETLEGGREEHGSGPITAEAYAALQQRLATLEGNFSRTNAELAAERGRAQTLERMLERRIAAPETAAPAPAAPPRSNVTDQEIEEYGADLTDFVRRLIRDAVSPLMDNLQRVEASIGQLRNVSEHTAEVTRASTQTLFAQRMNSLVVDAAGKPDWEHINHMHETGDTRFVDWLNETGEDSDEPRLGIIQRAFQRGDADRCARMINRFKQEVGLADGNARPDPASPPANAAAALVSPPASGASSAVRPREATKKTYTVDDINRHYDEKTKGKWKGREDAWQKIAGDMDRAVVENRFSDPARRR